MKFFTDIEAVLCVWDGQKLIEIRNEIETNDPAMIALLKSAGLRHEGEEPAAEPPYMSPEIPPEAPPEEPSSDKSLDKMTYQELRALAKKREIEGFHKLNTEELREVLKGGGNDGGNKEAESDTDKEGD